MSYIYPEEMEVIKTQPYSIQVLINSNTEDEERNFLKVQIMIEL